MRRFETWQDRFWAKVDKSGDCWEWTAFLTPDGYGRFGLDGAIVAAHRTAYELVVGPIPDGLQIDHLCRNRKCVNPDHLEPVTQLENARRGFWATKTHCKHGHEFTPENTYIRPTGARQCRTCNRAAVATYKARSA